MKSNLPVFFFDLFFGFLMCSKDLCIFPGYKDFSPIFPSESFRVFAFNIEAFNSS